MKCENCRKGLTERIYVTIVKKNILKCILDQISIMITASYQELDVKHGFHFKTVCFTLS